MQRRHSILFFILSFVSLLSIASAANPTSFCKCTCFSNSTIIPLNGPQSVPSTSHRLLEPRSSKKTCNDCNRQFCLNQGLEICKKATEEDVFTTCFQRDSAKDQAVVFIFVIATVGLLLYAIFQPWVEGWIEKYRERRSYAPIPGHVG